jgi:hypothetical protein
METKERAPQKEHFKPEKELQKALKNITEDI